LAFEIAKQFVLNFLNYELGEVRKGNSIKVLGLEVPMEVMHDVKGLNMAVKLKGKIDRIDQFNGVSRILDYKTGKVTLNQLKINDWSLLSADEKFSKSFQVLTYAYMYLSKAKLSLKELSLESGIISFKNLKDGFMPFNGGLLTEDNIASYVIELDKLLTEIFDTSVPFLEKELATFNY